MFFSKNLIKQLRFAIFLPLLASSSSFGSEKSIAKKALDLYSSSLALDRKPTAPVKNKRTFQAEQLTRNQMLPIAIEQVQKLPTQKLPKTTALDQNFLKKMELFQNNESSDNSLLQRINKTETIFGNVILAQQIVQPRYDISHLENVQSSLKFLITDKAIYNDIQEQLEILRENEHHFLSYFQQSDTINEELFKKVYWGNRLNFLNSNEWTLELGVRLGMLGNLFSVSCLPLVLTSITAEAQIVKAALSEKPITFKNAFVQGTKNLLNPQLDSYKDGGVQKIKDNLVDSYKTFEKISKTIQQKSMDLKYKNMNYFEKAKVEKELVQLQQQLAEPIKNMFINIFSFVPQTMGDVSYLLKNAEGKSKYIGLAIVGSLAAFQGYLTYNALQETILKQNIYNYLQAKLIGVASYINALKNLATIIYRERIYSDSLLSVTGEDELFALCYPELITNQSSDLKKLLDLLSHPTFTGNASAFSLTGRILRAHKLMQKVKEELIPASVAAGQLDVYMSTAKLYMQYQNSPAQFCFATFDGESQQASITAHNFWNPFIDADKVVTNDIVLGIPNPNNIILTGPNTGGKSTVIKGILLTILLSQTLGIAPAQAVTLTPFAHLNCYLNITDDLTSGNSLFQAEILRAKTLIDAIRNLKDGEFSFTIIDEVFSGTSPLEGEEAAVRFAQELGAVNNSICCISTHFPRLTQELPFDQFKNYQVTVYKDENGNWIRPFTLTEGASSINIALELLQDEGIFTK